LKNSVPRIPRIAGSTLPGGASGRVSRAERQADASRREDAAAGPGCPTRRGDKRQDDSRRRRRNPGFRLAAAAALPPHGRAASGFRGAVAPPATGRERSDA
jgi:hypothetical protein